VVTGISLHRWRHPSGESVIDICEDTTPSLD
jgi:hypothetical protein